MAFLATLYPNRVGDSTDWTPSVGGAANWAMVADQTGTTTISTQTVNALDLYYLTALPIDTYNMAAPLHPWSNFEFLAAGGSQIAPVYKRGGVLVVDTAINGNGAWQSMAKNPARPSGGSWVVGDFSGLQVGFKAIAVAGGDTIYVRKAKLTENYQTRASANVVLPVDADTVLVSDTYPARDPVPVSLDLKISNTNVTNLEVNNMEPAVFGPILIPGQKHPVYVSLSLNSLTNLGEGL